VCRVCRPTLVGHATLPAQPTVDDATESRAKHLAGFVIDRCRWKALRHALSTPVHHGPCQFQLTAGWHSHLFGNFVTVSVNFTCRGFIPWGGSVSVALSTSTGAASPAFSSGVKRCSSNVAPFQWNHKKGKPIEVT